MGYHIQCDPETSEAPEPQPCNPENAWPGFCMQDVGLRFYSPAMGRWINRDPLEEYAGPGCLYAYIDNRPIDQLDPHGLFSLWRWLYTGDWNAPDDVYTPALDGAAESLECSLNELREYAPLVVALNFYSRSGEDLGWSDGDPFVHRLQRDPALRSEAAMLMHNLRCKARCGQIGRGSVRETSDLMVLDTLATGDLGSALILGRFYLKKSGEWSVNDIDWTIKARFTIVDRFDFAPWTRILALGLLEPGAAFHNSIEWTQEETGKCCGPRRQ